MIDYISLFDEIISSDRGAMLLMNIVMAEYGPRDAVLCMFPHINEADQQRFLGLAGELTGGKRMEAVATVAQTMPSAAPATGSSAPALPPSVSDTATTAPRIHTRKRYAREKMIEYNGVKRNLNEWSRVCGIARTTIDQRLKAGWSIEEALCTPVMRSGRTWNTVTMMPCGTIVADNNCTV